MVFFDDDAYYTTAPIDKELRRSSCSCNNNKLETPFFTPLMIRKYEVENNVGDLSAHTGVGNEADNPFQFLLQPKPTESPPPRTVSPEHV